MIDNLRGIYPPLTTPFTGDELALDKLLRNLRKYRKTRTFWLCSIWFEWRKCFSN